MLNSIDQKPCAPRTAATLPATPALSADTVQRFLRYYGAGLEEVGTRLALFFLPEAETFASHDLSAIAAAAGTAGHRSQNIYLHVQLHELPEGRLKGRGSRDTARVAIGLVADIDAQGPGRKKKPESLCPTPEDAIWVVDEFNRRHHPLSVGMVVSSGHGSYPFLLFKEPFVIRTADDVKRLEAVNRRFHASLHAIASERGWTGAVDYCDLAKVLRLPGTLNLKDPANPQPVEIVREHPARFNVGDLEELLPSAASVPGANTTGMALEQSTDTAGIIYRADAEFPIDLLNVICEQQTRFKETWNHQRTDLADTSCSGYDMALAAMGIRAGLTDQQIADLLVHHRRNFVGERKELRSKQAVAYLTRTISNCRRSLSSGPSPLEFLLAKVRSTKDPRIVFESVPMLARLREGEFRLVFQQLKAELGTKLHRNDFMAAVRDSRKHLAATQAAGDQRPTIRVDDRLLDEMAREAISALEKANNPPKLFRREGVLVTLHSDEIGRMRIVAASDPVIRGRLARVARFVKQAREGWTRVSPPEHLATDIRTSNEGAFPALRLVTQTPLIRPNGTLCLAAGYDSDTAVYYHPCPGFCLGVVPDQPTAQDAANTIKVLLDEVIGEFPFETPADRANCLGLILSPILKTAWNLHCPLAVIDATKWGTGKTLLAGVVYAITTGSEPTVCTAPTTDDEWRKRIGSILESGETVVVIDNVERRLQSQSLCAVLTTVNWADRLLGRISEVRYPNVATWIVTGNNIVVGGEIGRRIYRIRLDAKMANPAQRTGFKRSDHELLYWVLQNRGQLVAGLLALIRAWIIAGKPAAPVPAFGSFSGWARTVGGILAYAGVSDFLANLHSVQVETDEESTQWEQFLRALAFTFPRSTFTATEVVEKAIHTRGILSQSFPDEIGYPDEAQGERQSFQKRLGKAFARKCRTRFGQLDLRIERAEPDTHTKIQRWRVGGNIAAVSAGDVGSATADTGSAGFSKGA